MHTSLCWGSLFVSASTSLTLNPVPTKNSLVTGLFGLQGRLTNLRSMVFKEARSLGAAMVVAETFEVFSGLKTMDQAAKLEMVDLVRSQSNTVMLLGFSEFPSTSLTIQRVSV